MLSKRLLALLALSASVFAEPGPEEPQQDQQQEVVYEDFGLSYPYSERLDVTPLPHNHVFATFKFFLESEPVDVSKPVTYTHYKSFPRTIAPILDQTNTRELHMRFGQGWWDSENWGQLPNSGQSAGGVGIEIWAIVEARDQEESFRHWRSLVNSLSGLFCASLNFIDRSKTVYPINSFTSNTDIPLFNESNSLFLMRAALPSEPVCTENLTPFMKFLPTRGKAGLSSLLDGHRFFESEWHMMAIDVETHCENDICKLEMTQTIDAVVDIERSLRRKHGQIPKPVHGDELRCDPTKPHDAFQCFPLNQEKEITYSLSDLFGRTINGGNLVSRSDSRVCVHTPPHWNVYLKAGDGYFGTGDNCFDLSEQIEYDVRLESTNSFQVENTKPAPILVSRSLTGYGLDKGGLRTVFKNDLDSETRLVYLETLPWFMRIYLHTLEVTGAPDNDNVIRSIYYQPEEDRKRPTHLEFEIVLPPRSVITINYSFEKSLLLLAEYPPDANHGFSIEPGVIKVIEPINYELRTSPSLLVLPTPDFSMPYNVIIFTATVMSLTFGAIFNLVFKRTVLESDADLVDEFSPKNKLRAKIQLAKSKVASKVSLVRDFKAGVKARLLNKVSKPKTEEEALPSDEKAN